MSKSLLKELISFRKKEKISMHIPGHKSSRGLSAYFRKNAFSIDLTELSGTDNLQNPDGILKNAQENCAKIFGAEETHFLTGGSSLGLRAMILGCVPRGGKLLVDRCCHKSVISAIAIGGARPVFLEPDFDDDLGLYLGVSAEEVKSKLEDHPDVCGAIITSPNYYGICSEVSAIADLLHKDNKFLIVDEAHGAHFAFDKADLPQTALSLKADLCVQSAHKTLPALGQCSLLHIRENALINKERLIRALRHIQTTSPSYMLMASLDEAAGYMDKEGRKALANLVEEIAEFKAEVIKKTALRFADSRILNRPQDETRIVVDFSPLGISGFKAERILAEEFGIFAEMADSRYVVFIPSVATTKNELKKLCKVLCRIGKRKFESNQVGKTMRLPEVHIRITPCDATDKPFEVVGAGEAAGRISAGVVSACPPGAAVIIPGQYIDETAVDFIIKNKVADKVEVITQ